MVADVEKVIVSDGIISLVPKGVVIPRVVGSCGIHIRLLSQEDK